MNFPELKQVERDREYRNCPERIRDKIIYKYLFEGKSHRWLDENTIDVNSDYSRGWMSMGVLHYLGLVDAHKGIYLEHTVLDAINLLTDIDKEKHKHIILALIRYSQNLYADDGIEMFNPPINTSVLFKNVGTSQYTDGVRIEKEFHNTFNPVDTSFYVKRGTARKVKVLFNNKVFEADYRYEGQEDKTVELQSIRFRKELKEEFLKVYPQPFGEFTIQQGVDLNHFIFTHKANSVIDDDVEYPEGMEAYKIHKIRERNHEVIRKAKDRFKKKNNGYVFCEACGFDFFKAYGKRGIDYIEGHHKKLVSEMGEGEKTKIEDISMLCANCHSMIHRKPFITIEKLSELIKNNK